MAEGGLARFFPATRLTIAGLAASSGFRDVSLF